MTEAEAKLAIQSILSQTITNDPMKLVRNSAKLNSIKQLNKAIINCNDCKFNNHPCKTLAVGDYNSPVMIIGDCVLEDQKGELLAPYENTKEIIAINNVFKSLNVNPNKIFWMNTVNCYTSQEVDGHNIYRCPNSKEIERCSTFMKYAVDVIHPVMIILMGGIALNCFKSISITKGHGIWTTAFTIPAMPVYSLSYIKQLKEKSNVPDEMIIQMQNDFITDMTNAFNYLHNIYPNCKVFLDNNV